MEKMHHCAHAGVSYGQRRFLFACVPLKRNQGEADDKDRSSWSGIRSRALSTLHVRGITIVGSIASKSVPRSVTSLGTNVPG